MLTFICSWSLTFFQSLSYIHTYHLHSSISFLFDVKCIARTRVFVYVSFPHSIAVEFAWGNLIHLRKIQNIMWFPFDESLFSACFSIFRLLSSSFQWIHTLLLNKYYKKCQIGSLLWKKEGATQCNAIVVYVFELGWVPSFFSTSTTGSTAIKPKINTINRIYSSLFFTSFCDYVYIFNA